MEQLTIALQHLDIDTATLKSVIYSGTDQLYQLTVPFHRSEALWKVLRAAVPQTGYYPAIINDMAIIEDYERNDWEGTPAEILAQAELRYANSIHEQPERAEQIVAHILKEIEELHDALGDDFVAYEDMKYEGEHILTDDLYWSIDQTVTHDQQFDPKHTKFNNSSALIKTQIMFFPTTHSWQVPAFLRYRPADPGPSISDLVYYLRRWSDAYGADIALLEQRSMTLDATRPPRDRRAALELAWEHRDLNDDTVGEFDVINRARDLFKGEAWSFWWD